MAGQLPSSTSRVVRISRTTGSGQAVEVDLHFNESGQLHRTDGGPACIYKLTTKIDESGPFPEEGTVTTLQKSWYCEGRLHHTEGPAFISTCVRSITEGCLSIRRRFDEVTVTKRWYTRGKLHRNPEEGPATTRSAFTSRHSKSRSGDVDKHETEIGAVHYSFYVDGKLHREGDRPAKVFHRLCLEKAYDELDDDAPDDAPAIFEPRVSFWVEHGFWHRGLPHPEHPTEVVLTSSFITEGPSPKIRQADRETYHTFLRTNPCILDYNAIVESESLQRYQNVPNDHNLPTILGCYMLTQSWLDEKGELHREGGGPALVRFSRTLDKKTTWVREYRTHGRSERQNGDPLVKEVYLRRFVSGMLSSMRVTNTYKREVRGYTEVVFSEDSETGKMTAFVESKLGEQLHDLFGPAQLFFENLSPHLLWTFVVPFCTPETVIVSCEGAPGAECTRRKWFVFGKECLQGDGQPDLVAQERNKLARRAVRRWRRRCGIIPTPPPANGLIVVDGLEGKLYMNFRDGRLHNTDQIPHLDRCAYAFVAEGEATPCEQWSYVDGLVQGTIKAMPAPHHKAEGEAYALMVFNKRDRWGELHGQVIDDFNPWTYYIHGLEVTQAQYLWWESKWGGDRNNICGLWPTARAVCGGCFIFPPTTP